VYDAVIFDNDGVLVEPPREETLRSAAREAFGACGVADPDPDDVAAVVRGVTPDLLDDLAADYGFDPQEFWLTRDRTASRAQRADVEAGHVGPYDDAAPALATDPPAAVVSSNQQATVDFLLDRFDLADRFVSAYGRQPGIDDLRRKKPDPHYLERAIEDVERERGLAPERVLMVGDSESDVRAAHNAGVDSAYVHRPHCEGSLSVDPHHEFDGLDDLAGLLDGGAAEG
jgi:HAD superfamily hydrolase (TIGR01549 family)